ncbi:hypothetical protein BJF93_06400 [Xaviernesmea oryzae]|uniref:Uncharacterized protein n=1 Tax=Xaviernesmea oryzae TaxID=464029 RepID=A0A1Q9AS33_9HYPH|nr:hypothetical protein [Xaviernesmea oryzae]OLP58244.1 hypothetical protein BJF93_06400 [Xaviernesmea oryzae]SEL45138.1 hypothetical protein SAMN04487976_108132 [Xaviernesmea oryzae]
MTSEPGRLLAALWMLLAILSMPIVAAAPAAGQGSLPRSAGDATGSAGRAGEPAALTRQALRAAPPADLKFSAERGDPKAVPGGPDPAILSCPLGLAQASVVACRLAVAEIPVRPLRLSQAHRPRAPPTTLD